MNPVDVLNQINRLTTDVIEVGICEAQNFPSMKSYPGDIREIGFSSSDNSIFLKNIPYREMYSELLKKKNYNIKMIDGALISLLYRFRGNELLSHRLSFFPAPDLEVFQNEPEFYSMDEMYLDILDQRVVTVPLRFDFDSGDAFIPVEHPKSHLTLGQYENCRIPVSSAVSPFQFMDFILRNFYHTAHIKFCERLTRYSDRFEKSILPEEEALIHVCTSP